MVAEELEKKWHTIKCQMDLLAMELQKDAIITPPYSYKKEYLRKIKQLELARDILSL